MIVQTTPQMGLTIMQTGGIDGKLTLSNLLFTTQAGRNFLVLGAMARSEAATSITIEAAGSLGTNSTDYDDILPITTLTELLATNDCFNLTPALGKGIIVPPETGVYFKVTTAATGTAQTLGIDVIGYYID